MMNMFSFFNPFQPNPFGGGVVPVATPAPMNAATVAPTVAPAVAPVGQVVGMPSQQSALNAGFADMSGVPFNATVLDKPAGYVPPITPDPVVNRDITSEQSAIDAGFSKMGEAEMDMDGSTKPKPDRDIPAAIQATADLAKSLEGEPMSVPTAPAIQKSDYKPVTNPYANLDTLGKIAPRLGLKLSNI